ncbi:MAG: DUF2730 family protein [Maricaulaceae bacterium]|nr:DUF2730 family protein [Maricaulaceae bacterium]
MNQWEALSIGALGAAVAAGLKFAFDLVAARIGWAREDRRGLKQRVETGDAQARAEISRVEKELAERLNATDRKLARLEEKVGHLPTGADVKALTQEVAVARRETARLAAGVEGQSMTLKTIMDYLLGQEKRS